eukprot:TRINITY_DN17928_c0_g1_i2.p1 TRINITY_DN17928_c0_g1~~TRINITY_DN17928_c0_g1_i2.p1  ORF type:complete len:198 (+),score=28.55 TRINITY_DN17928_c0_g1_i2:60-653(+)
MSTMAFNAEQREFMLRMVRTTAQNALDGTRDRFDWGTEAKRLGLEIPCGGCFTTYHNKGELRGCIGIFSPKEPLWEVAISRALETLEDSRFFDNPITPKEFKNEISISISVLSTPVRIKDPLTEVKVGVHGIIVSKRGYRGTYLPQVATEQGWDVKKFCTHCATRKAGIPGDPLNDPEVKWETYTATVIDEKEENEE